MVRITGGAPEENTPRSSSNNVNALKKIPSDVGRLAKDVPSYVREPPIEAVVFGWGVAEDGQLGLDTEQNVHSPKVVEALLGTRLRGRDFTSCPLVAGSRTTLAIASEGQVLSWGWNARRTLGHGDRDTERKPQRVVGLAGVRILQVALGGWHCLALSDDGQVYAWGGNEYGQVSSSLPLPSFHSPFPYAWGGNEYGQCGLPEEHRDVIKVMPIVTHLKVTHVSAGGMHSCVVTEGGDVWTWGEPWGDFSMKVKREPRQVIGAHHVAKIACGAFHNLALTWEGEVLSWGINDYGQLGTGSTVYETEPATVFGLENVRVADIAAGGWHSAALSANGEVYIWGRGEYGRLGLSDRSGSSKLRANKVKALEGHSVVQISCGGTHTLALTQEGRIFAWGRGSFGRLGTGVEKDCFSPVEVFLPGGPDRWRVICVSAGGRHSVCLALPDNSEKAPPARQRATSAQASGFSRQAAREAAAPFAFLTGEEAQQPPGIRFLEEDAPSDKQSHTDGEVDGRASGGLVAILDQEVAESELSEGTMTPAGYERELEGASSPEGSILGPTMVESALEVHDLLSPIMDDDGFHGAAPHAHFDK
eukprot:jgi/Botrbrau1/14222/Bobra.0254s0011.1